MRRARLFRENHRAGEGARNLRRPRSRLRRHLLRWLEVSVDHGGAGRQGRRRRVLHDEQKLQHGRLARRLHGRQSRSRLRAQPDQGLSRLRHVHADPGGVDRRTRRTAGMRHRDRDELPEASRRADQGPARSRLDGDQATRDNVRVGEDSGDVCEGRLARIRQEAGGRCESVGVARDRLRRIWR